MYKRKEREGPRKLTDFFRPAEGRKFQDGAGPRSRSSASTTQPHSNPKPSSGESHFNDNPLSSSPFCSPVKQKRRLGEGGENEDEAGAAGEEMEESSTQAEQLDAFPTSGQPIIDTTMKEMLQTLRGALQSDMAVFMSNTKREISAVSNRVEYVENKMEEFTLAHNELVDAHFEVEDEIRAMRLKMADIEDRARRNNIKFRGVPEMVKPAEITTYLQKLMMTVLPSLSPADITIDRAHRLPKPSFLPEQTPRDVIARIHFYHIKDQLMRFARQHPSLPDPYAGIALYADLSQATLSARHNLVPITKILRNNKILYKWGFPAKLLVDMNNESHAITSLEKGLDLLRKWRLLPADAVPEDPNPQYNRRNNHRSTKNYK